MSSSVEHLVNQQYKYGFVTDIEADVAPKGLSEDVIRLISAKKREPEWLLEWRLKAYRGWLKLQEPHHWANIRYTPVDYQAISYYSAPRTKKPLGSLDEVDPKLLETYTVPPLLPTRCWPSVSRRTKRHVVSRRQRRPGSDERSLRAAEPAARFAR